MALKAETLKKLACGEKWCLTNLEAFLFVNETSNKVLNLQSASTFNLTDVTSGHNNLLQLLIHWY